MDGPLILVGCLVAVVVVTIGVLCGYVLADQVEKWMTGLESLMPEGEGTRMEEPARGPARCHQAALDNSQQ